MTPTVLLILVAGGIAAGFVNTLAGGGSLLTLPILIFAGLDAQVANGTNRLAILMQSGLASWRFWRSGELDVRQTLKLSWPALAGAVLGAAVAVQVPPAVLRTTIAVVLVLAMPTVLFPQGITRGDTQGRRAAALVLPLIFLCGFYGGFLQAGVGIALLAVLVPLGGLDLVRANGVKNGIVTLYTALALAVFIQHGQVAFIHGLVLGVGNMIGAFLGTRLALKKGAAAVRWVVAGAILLAAIALLDLPARFGG